MYDCIDSLILDVLTAACMKNDLGIAASSFVQDELTT